ncbi:MAG: hypothetical protein KAS38_05555 [Anaerolineales bacterium]|nr:hypothetical protein [Anaerolineales bacterium]
MEPLSDSLKPTVKKLCSEAKRRVVIETAPRLTPLCVDILKAEFPLEITETPYEDVCYSACVELTEASHVPRTLLRAGVTFEDFTRQVKVACLSGASGVIVGRAVWKEAIELESKKDAFLTGLAQERMIQLTDLVTSSVYPWTINQLPNLTDGWYRDY